MEVAHIHFGAGALGLGLVIPAFADKANSASIFNRASADGAARLALISGRSGYWVDIFSGAGIEPRWVPVRYALEYQELARHCDDAFSRIKAVVVTTALKRSGIEASLNELALVCAKAQAKKIPVLIIAAENQVDSKWVLDNILGRLHSGEDVFQVRCVVDRICNKPMIVQRPGKKEGLSVLAESFSKIYINKTDLDSLPNALSDWLRGNKAPFFEFRDDFDFVVNQKKWIVNASHLLLAIYAHWSRYPTINNFADDYPEIVVRIVDDVTMMSSGALWRGRIASGVADHAFASQLKRRLGRFPQVPYDAVTRFTGPEKLFDFFEDFHRKIAEPYLATSVFGILDGGIPVLPSYITMCAIDLIAKNHWIRPQAP